MRTRLLIGSLTLGLGLASWFAVRTFEARRFREELARARGEFAARRFGAARVRLARMAERRPGEAEVEYLLGTCERIQGHPDAAMAAWARVPDGSDQSTVAALARGRLALELGRYRLGEECLVKAHHAEGEVGNEAARLLEWLYWMTGRRDDHRRLLRARARQAADPSKILRVLWSVDRDPYPVDGITAALARARRTAPDDDLLWLALADLALRTGHFDEADDWLRRCERARPDDPSVLRERIDWAIANGRPDELRRTAAHLPASSLTVHDVNPIRAWLARREGDSESEKTALEALIAENPGDDTGLERLADLAAQAGDRERVAELRHRKAAIDAARDHYKGLISEPDMAAHALELARTAGVIGRWFEARCWWTMALRQDSSLAAEAEAAAGHDDLAESVFDQPGYTLADLLGARRSTEPSTVRTARELAIPRFVDEARSLGLNFRFDNGRTEARQIPETMSGGVALLDFDGDGRLDVYALQGGPFPPSDPSVGATFGDRLFRNRPDGRFEDVTASSGLADLRGGYGHGVAVGDYDNDGRPDLFVTRWRAYALYHNLGGGRFEEATERAGLGGDRDWPTSAAWADLDGDGDLDLYVCHYLRWDARNPTLCEYPEHSRPGYLYCDPRGFPALADHVFRNEGGRFVDVTAQAGIVDRDGRGLGVLAADLDDDGRVDLFVANDTTANYFFRNQGGFRFVEQAEESGMAASAEGGYLAGMGVACGDFDGDGRLDVAVTNFFNQATTLYHNHGGGLFSDRSDAMGLAAATRQVLGFGLAALDANNDGRLDLAQANGHVTDFRPTIPLEMKAQLILGDSAGRFRDATDRAGPAWQTPRIGRGLAVGDIDNDGRIDLLVVSQDAPLALFRNRLAADGGHFLTLALEGKASNRDAVGARVSVTASGRTQMSERIGGGSYLSASDPRLHFGLGSATEVDGVEVRWPSGRRDRYEGLAVDSGYRLREGDPRPRPLAGFARVPASRDP